jgi:hypothetical protein
MLKSFDNSRQGTTSTREKTVGIFVNMDEERQKKWKRVVWTKGYFVSIQPCCWLWSYEQDD